MRLDSAPLHARHVSPATWGAATALVVLLGSLALFLIGCSLIIDGNTIPDCPDGEVVDGMCVERAANHYACQCDCTTDAEMQVFALDARIRVKNPASVRDAPAGSSLGQVQRDVQGTIVGGFVVASNVTWWEVDFDDTDTNLDGWADERLLAVLDTLVVKPLDVCLPPSLNANVGGVEPSPGDVDDDCLDRVAADFRATTGSQLPEGAQCRCGATASPDAWDSSCDAACPTDVCLVAGSDPPAPTPDPLGPTLFGATSTCEVTGTAEVHVGDEVKSTSVSGLVQIHGAPCPAGEGCQVGVSYQMALGDISIPVRFHKDPKIVDMSVSGASEPGVVDLAPFIGPLYAGQVPTAATLNSARARRQGQADHVVVVGRNGGPLDFAVDWVNKHCLLGGDFITDASGGIVDDDGNVQTLRVVMTVGGTDDSLSRLVNQPPRADAGSDQTVECTSPDGAPVDLSGANSTDADGNIAYYQWRQDGSFVTDPSADPAVTTAQAGGETTYDLRVVDRRLATGDDAVTVTVVDTTPPVIDCQAPATITPPEPPVAFTATATDLCGPSSVVIETAECFKVKPGGERETASCKVATDGATLTIKNAGGVDTLIRWVARATDAAGNVSRKTCQMSVANPGHDG